MICVHIAGLDVWSSVEVNARCKGYPKTVMQLLRRLAERDTRMRIYCQNYNLTIFLRKPSHLLSYRQISFSLSMFVIRQVRL